MANLARTENIRFGKHVLRLQRQPKGWAGIVEGRSVERFHADSREDLILTMERAVAQNNGEFIGYPQAIALFRRRHGNFADPSYMTLERDEKDAAARLLAEVAPLETALEAEGLAEDVLRVFTTPKFQLVNRFEVGKTKAMLKSPDGDAFLRAAALFCVDPTAMHLESLHTVAVRNSAQAWPILTCLPWLWAPDAHVFLKPEEMKSFSRAVGHPFHELYATASPFEVYEAARDLAGDILTETAELGPRDFIDTQGFIYVVCHPDLVPPATQG